jgi:ubiquinone/menaquinone biosynthesis C-methylase UbiE
MVNTQEWWDDFWIKQPPTVISIKENDETWYDLVWKVSLDYWHDLFEKLAPGKKMLECGCGSARISQYMAQHGYQCTLLDYSEKALMLAKSNFDSLSLDGQFVIGDMSRLSFRDEQFDVVFSGGVLEFFPDVQRPINEMVRVLRPGGVFSANMVPKKFSIQTIADIERTLAHSVRNLMRGRFEDIFKRVQHIPVNYNVNSVTLQDYIGFCEKAQLRPVVGLVTSPFPDVALPRFAKRLYAHVMKKLLKQWRKFNESKSRWTEVWGITYTIYGIKK